MRSLIRRRRSVDPADRQRRSTPPVLRLWRTLRARLATLCASATTKLALLARRPLGRRWRRSVDPAERRQPPAGARPPVSAGPGPGPVARVALWLSGGAMVLASFITLLPLPSWWVRVFDFPRVQIAILAALALIACVYLGYRRPAGRVLIALLVAAVVHQLYHIYPYTRLASYQALPAARDQAAPRFRLLVANVLMDNRNVSGLIEIVSDKDPDLILALETDRRWIDQLAVLHEDYPYRVLHPQDNTYGIALYSRLPLIGPRVDFLIQDDVPSIHTRFRLPGGTEVLLHALHPRPPSPTEHYRSTERDAELLLVGETIPEGDRPVVVAGDMNDVAWSTTTRRFQRISGLLDPRVGRGVYGTFHAGYPLLRWPLDHVFFSDELRLVEMQRLPYFGSDHFPISITLSYEPQLSGAQREPEEADTEDHQEARETIGEALRSN